jgi:hypothetical protein
VRKKRKLKTDMCFGKNILFFQLVALKQKTKLTTAEKDKTGEREKMAKNSIPKRKPLKELNIKNNKTDIW